MLLQHETEPLPPEIIYKKNLRGLLETRNQSNKEESSTWKEQKSTQEIILERYFRKYISLKNISGYIHPLLLNSFITQVTYHIQTSSLIAEQINGLVSIWQEPASWKS